MPKYVVSATRGSADEWDHTTIVGYDDIAGLREREQLLTYGCGRLARNVLADGCSTCSCCRSRPSWRAPAGGCSTTPATWSGCGSRTARPSRPAPCGCSLSRIKSDRSSNRVLLSMLSGGPRSALPIVRSVSCPACCSMSPAVADRRRRCRASRPAARRATRAAGIPPIRRPSRRSSPSCDRQAPRHTASACAG